MSRKLPRMINQFKNDGAANKWLKKGKNIKISKISARKPITTKFTYKKYINGSIWEKRKNLYYQTYKKKCKKCGSHEYVCLHHMYYDSKMDGKEPDNILVPLCLKHHKEFHKIYGTHKDMVSMTLEFIRS